MPNSTARTWAGTGDGRGRARTGRRLSRALRRSSPLPGSCPCHRSLHQYHSWATQRVRDRPSVEREVCRECSLAATTAAVSPLAPDACHGEVCLGTTASVGRRLHPRLYCRDDQHCSRHLGFNGRVGLTCCHTVCLAWDIAVARGPDARIGEPELVQRDAKLGQDVVAAGPDVRRVVQAAWSCRCLLSRHQPTDIVDRVGGAR